MADRLPWFKFNTTDWRGDAQLRGCSAAAQGVWINMLALMHESTPYGHLPVNPSDNPSVNRPLLALQLGMREADVIAGLAELEQRGIFSRTADGVIFSRRMVRDAERAERNALNGRRGGNPRLADGESVNHSDKPAVNPSVKPSDKPARAHARSGLSLLSKDKEGGDLTAARFETFWDAYPNKANKKGAAKAFAHLEPNHESLTVLIDAVKAQAQTRQWKEGFVPHAQTWLNGERWKDVVPEPIAPKPAVTEWVPPRPPLVRDLIAQGKL